jgi:hypothetical protein
MAAAKDGLLRFARNDAARPSESHQSRAEIEESPGMQTVALKKLSRRMLAVY